MRRLKEKRIRVNIDLNLARKGVGFTTSEVLIPNDSDEPKIYRVSKVSPVLLEVLREKFYSEGQTQCSVFYQFIIRFKRRQPAATDFCHVVPRARQ